MERAAVRELELESMEPWLLGTMHLCSGLCVVVVVTSRSGVRGKRSGGVLVTGIAGTKG